MLDRQKMEYEITYVFSLLSTNITFNSQQSKLDINKVMETVLTELLNKVCHASFINLNKLRHNHPAIDLGDINTGAAVQVTSDGSRAKFEKTVDKFIKHGLDKDYHKLTFFIISNDPKISFSRKPFEIDVQNLSDLAKDICNLEVNHFNEIYSFCKINLSVYFPGSNRSMLEPTLKSSVAPSNSICFFLQANQIDLNDNFYKCSEEDIRQQLIILKDKLSKLSDNQRWFIFLVMDYTLVHSKTYWPECCIPRSVMENSNNNIVKSELKNIADSVEHIGLASYDEEIRELGSDGFYVYYKNDVVPEFEYFTAIIVFIRKTLDEPKQSNILKQIIVGCDFSCIN